MNTHHSQSGFSIVEISVVIATVAIIGALGWKYYDAQTNKTQTNNVSADTATVDIQPDTLTDLTEIATIQKTALTDKPGVTVIHIELEKNDAGTLVYKAQLSDGTVTVYNAKTGARIKSSTETVKASEVLPSDFTPGIGFAKALEIARAEKPASKIKKIELEFEGGVTVYSVRFTDKARVDVNAQTGTIVRTKAAKPEETKPATESSRSNSNSSNSHSTKSPTPPASSTPTRTDDSSHHDDRTDDSRLSDSDDDDDIDNLDDRSGKDDSDDDSGRGRGRGRD